MPLIHHVVRGGGPPPIVFVHGFACAQADWDAQVAHFSPRHRVVTVDLRGHGASAGTADECSIERYGADVAEVMHALDLRSAVVVGHSMGCRVVLEAALQAPSRVAAVVFVDGSQFVPAMADVLQQAFAAPDGFVTLTGRWFTEMFTAKSNPAVVASVVERAQRLPRAIGEKVMADLVRYDVTRLTTSLADLHVPLQAIQATYSNEKRERRPLNKGQSTPFLNMLRSRVATVRVEIIADTGHFPQIDEPAQLNALLDDFLAAQAKRGE
jgi:pimeloyl-ACP methyl ester carboxylesterase